MALKLDTVIQTQIKVRFKTRWARQRGYVGWYPTYLQELTKVYGLFGRIIWTKVLDTEEVPQQALIDRGTLGYTDWRSKWAKTHPGAYKRNDTDLRSLLALATRKARTANGV